MTLQNPLALLGLMLIPLLILLKLWRHRPSKVVVPSLLLWQKLKEGYVSTESHFQKKLFITLLLQALAVFILVLGWALPILVCGVILRGPAVAATNSTDHCEAWTFK